MCLAILSESVFQLNALIVLNNLNLIFIQTINVERKLVFELWKKKIKD